MLTRFLRNKKPGSATRQAKPVYIRLSDADLADMGIKRYQLENFISK